MPLFNLSDLKVGLPLIVSDLKSSDINASQGNKNKNKKEKKTIYTISKITPNGIYITDGLNVDLLLAPNFTTLTSGKQITSVIYPSFSVVFESNAETLMRKNCPNIILKSKPLDMTWYNYMLDYKKIEVLASTQFLFINTIDLQLNPHNSILLYYFYIFSMLDYMEVPVIRNTDVDSNLLPRRQLAGELVEQQMKNLTLYSPGRLLDAKLFPNNVTFSLLKNKKTFNKEEINLISFLSQFKAQIMDAELNNTFVKVCSYCLEKSFIDYFNNFRKNLVEPLKESVATFLKDYGLVQIANVPNMLQNLHFITDYVTKARLSDIFTGFNYEYLVLYCYYEIVQRENINRDQFLLFKSQFENMTISNNQNEQLAALSEIDISTVFLEADFNTFLYFVRYFSVNNNEVLPSEQYYKMYDIREYAKKSEWLFNFGLITSEAILALSYATMPAAIDIAISYNDIETLRWYFRNIDVLAFKTYLDRRNYDSIFPNASIAKSTIGVEVINLYRVHNIPITEGRWNSLLHAAITYYNIPLIDKLIEIYDNFDFDYRDRIDGNIYMYPEIFDKLLSNQKILIKARTMATSFFDKCCQQTTEIMDIFLSKILTANIQYSLIRHFMQFQNPTIYNYTMLDRIIKYAKVDFHRDAVHVIMRSVFGTFLFQLAHENTRLFKYRFYNALGVYNYLLSYYPDIYNDSIQETVRSINTMSINSIPVKYFRDCLMLNSIEIMDAFNKKGENFIRDNFDRHRRVNVEMLSILGNTNTLQYLKNLNIRLEPGELNFGYASNKTNVILDLKNNDVPVTGSLITDVGTGSFFASSMENLLLFESQGTLNGFDYPMENSVLAANLEMYKYYRRHHPNHIFVYLNNNNTATDLSVFKFIYDNEPIQLKYVLGYLISRKTRLYYDAEELFSYIYNNVDKIVNSLLVNI